jgi:flagellar hook-associated protein 2
VGLSSAGIGSNLPIESIITQLMSIEQRPLTILDKKVTDYKAKLSAIGTIKSAFATFQTALKGLADISKFQAVSASTGDSTVASATAGPRATAGSYSLEVSKLAQAQKLASAGQASTSAPIGTAAATISFDFGTITAGSGGFDTATGKYASGASFASGGTGVKTVTIDPANSSLSGIRDAINNAKIGVTASIVNDGSNSPYRLVLTAANSGQANSMQISVAGDTGLQALLNHDPAGSQAMTESVAAQNAQFKLDGIAISSATNTATNVIDGVTLNLTKTNAGTPTSVTVARDTSAVATSVGNFVSAYNAITKTLGDLSSYNPTTKQGAVLNGDSTVRGLQSQLRSLLTTPISGAGAFTTLSAIGVTVKSGVMAVDDAKLKSAIDSNFNDIASLFAAVGKPSDSLVSYQGSTADTVAGTYAVNISRVATHGSTTATAAANLVINSSNSQLQVQLDGRSATITLGEGTYADAAALAAEVQSKINGVASFAAAGSAVTVSESGGQLTITSNRYGSASNVSLASGAGADSLLGAGPAITGGLDVAGTIGGVAATGAGRTLTGADGSPSAGLALLIDGIGNRGTVTYSQGYASQFDRLATRVLDTISGPLTSRTDGINRSLKSLENSRVVLTDRLAATEQRYRAQYSALDATISSMNATSSYLTQQLAQLSKLD